MRHNCMGRPTQSTVKELEKPHAKSQRWKLEAVVIASNCTIASPYVRITQGRYIEVYIPISLEVCVLRSETGMHSLDPKWLPSKLIIFKNTYVCRNTILRHINALFSSSFNSCTRNYIISIRLFSDHLKLRMLSIAHAT